MSPAQKQRDRLLTATSRSMGLPAVVAALLCVSLPGAVPFPGPYLVTAVLLLLAGAGYYLLRPGGSRLWITASIAGGIGAVISIGALGGASNAATTSAVAMAAGGVLGAAALVISVNARRIVLLCAAFATSAACVVYAQIAGGGDLIRPLALTLCGWAFAIVVATWIDRVVPRTVRRIANMSGAYRAERQASEQEARRRQGARLLHDTVLATLTLLAHSGRGVGADALREQAGEDAALLRQLRMGQTPDPAASGDYKLRPVIESTLGTTLESVKQRFRRMGLEVAWHGSGHVLLPSDRLDAFLLALAECLENVRRHSGVEEAHVTITDDEDTVRAMVTDSGVGFDLQSVEPGRLGFTESIVARLRDVGGNARLFSSPGSGTTVVLEVPK
jgi:Signal transduction histidine kinase